MKLSITSLLSGPSKSNIDSYKLQEIAGKGLLLLGFITLFISNNFCDAAILSDQERLDKLYLHRTSRNTVKPNDVFDPGFTEKLKHDPSIIIDSGDQLQSSSSSADSSTSHQVQAQNWHSLIPNVWADYYSVPWEMLNPQDLDSMGLSEFTKTGRFFDIKSLGPSFALTLPIDENGLFIPGNTSLLFMFNTSRLATGPKQKSSKEKKDVPSTSSKLVAEINSNPDPEVNPGTISERSSNSLQSSDSFVNNLNNFLYHEPSSDSNGRMVYTDPDSKAEAVKIIQTSLPFGLPRYHYVINYSLLVPKHLLKLEHQMIPVISGDKWVNKIGLRRVAIPLSKEMLQTEGPVLVFVFRSGESLRDFVEEEDVANLLAKEEKLEMDIKNGFTHPFSAMTSLLKSSGLQKDTSAANANTNTKGQQKDHHRRISISALKAKKQYNHAKNRITDALVKSSSDVAKAVLASSSTFFDNFAKRWAATVGVESLLHSTFCQVNCRYHEQSYCLKFEKEGNAVVSLLTIPSDKLNTDHSDAKEMLEDDEQQQQKNIPGQIFASGISMDREGVSAAVVDVIDIISTNLDPNAQIQNDNDDNNLGVDASGKEETGGKIIIIEKNEFADNINGLSQESFGLKKRGLSSLVDTASNIKDDVHDKLEDVSYSLGNFMNGIRDYATHIGIQGESRYYSLRAFLSDTFGKYEI